MLNIFSTMKSHVGRKVSNKEPGLYVSIIFPIVVAFLITFLGARIISYLAPQIYLPILGDVRVHHFTYGFFVLAASGYLALVHDGPRALYLIALLHGFGLGLAFDEFGIWLHLDDGDPARWSYDGFTIIIGFAIFILTAAPGIRLIKILWPLWPFRDRKKRPISKEEDLKNSP